MRLHSSFVQINRGPAVCSGSNGGDSHDWTTASGLLDRIGLCPASVSEGRLKKQLGEYFLVGTVDGSIAAYIYGEVRMAGNMVVFSDGEQYLEIEDLYVAPHQRRSEMGSRLLTAAELKARARGINRLLVYSSTKDLDSIVKFYRRHGLRSWHVQMYK